MHQWDWRCIDRFFWRGCFILSRVETWYHNNIFSWTYKRGGMNPWAKLLIFSSQGSFTINSQIAVLVIMRKKPSLVQILGNHSYLKATHNSFPSPSETTRPLHKGLKISIKTHTRKKPPPFESGALDTWLTSPMVS